MGSHLIILVLLQPPPILCAIEGQAGSVAGLDEAGLGLPWTDLISIGTSSTLSQSL